MAPKHPGGETAGKNRGEERGATPAARRERSARDDSAFIEQIVEDILAQNERAQAASSLHSTLPSSGAPPLELERPRTVRVERDSGFRTPEGAATARAYLPAKTVAPSRREQVETETVKLSDPRKLPTMRLPRREREALRDDVLRDDGALSDPSPSVPEDSAPTLRSAPVTQAAPRKRGTMSYWLVGVVAVALLGALVVVLAARFWPVATARPVPSAPSSGAPLAAPPPAAPSHETSSAAAPSVTPDEGAAPAPAAAPRSAPRSDRWF